MKKRPKASAMGRRHFLAATTTLLAAAVPGGATIANASDSPLRASSREPAPAAGNLRKIPIGVFDPVYEHLSLDPLLDKLSALGLDAMWISTRRYPKYLLFPSHAPPTH